MRMTNSSTTPGFSRSSNFRHSFRDTPENNREENKTASSSLIRRLSGSHLSSQAHGSSPSHQGKKCPENSPHFVINI